MSKKGCKHKKACLFGELCGEATGEDCDLYKTIEEFQEMSKSLEGG
ncbi:MAG: hypothetical protein GY861_18605 [bacterium]|nr:hypothetical protein [bacterium]